MNGFRAFLRRKNIVFSAKRYGVDALGAMAQGLFCTLLVGTILDTLGTQFHIGFLAGGVRGSVTLEGVAFDGCTLSLSLPTGAVNAGATGQPYEGILAGVAPDATVTYRGEGSVELTAPAPAATQSTQKGNKDPQ